MTMQILAVRAGSSALLTPSCRELPKLINDPEISVWVVMDADGEEEREVLQDVLGIHPLLVDDAFNSAQSPKVEDHGNYMYLILHGLRIGSKTALDIDTTDLDLFIGKNFLVTHYHRDLSSVQRVVSAVEKEPKLLAQGPAVIAHRLIDHMIDQYFPLMEQLDEQINKLEDEALGGAGKAFERRVFELKRGLLRLRRTGLYQRDILHRLARGDFALLPVETRPFYRDVYDHFIRITDEADSYRELVASAYEAHLGVQGQKLNEIMKVLTLFSTIVLPLNFITGLYGMNFDHMPGLHWAYGYETAIIAMVTLVASLFFFFRNKDWI
jgi:magnesium transporter